MAERVPEFAERPGYGIYPCANEWHTTSKPYPKPDGSCPDCPNGWWASDGSECPDEYAWIAEIDELRAQVVSLRRLAVLLSEVAKDVAHGPLIDRTPPEGLTSLLVDKMVKYRKDDGCLYCEAKRRQGWACSEGCTHR